VILCFTKCHGVWYVMATFLEKSSAPTAIKIEAVYSLDMLLTTYKTERCHMTQKITLCVFITIKNSNLIWILKFGRVKTVGLRNVSSGVLLCRG
jgi:uncharacterized protein with PQ loop repeat